MTVANILLVDDDKNFLKVLNHHVQQFGFRAVPVPSGKAALEKLETEKFDLVITDLRMPEMDGMSLLREIRPLYPELPVLVLTAHGSIDVAVEAIKLGAFDFLSKPFDREEMRHTIHNALKLTSLEKENRELARAVKQQFSFEGMVGSSKRFKEVLTLAAHLAEVDTTVLIQGESGTGKEILARAIHFNSPRGRKPFVVVNCGAIPENLIESELFGYRKGAFTGAIADKKGKFEVADSGTIFLDEIGELPFNMQVKLLRVLQEKEIDIVGDPHSKQVDVRILAATNRDLAALKAEGAFRDDLYYRLTVAPLYLPPLRERVEDIPLLVSFFLRRFEKEFGKSLHLQPEVLDTLQAYPWPGNVRELENIIHRLVVFHQEGPITIDSLPQQIRRPLRTVGKVGIQLPDQGISMDELEKDLLLAALEKHGWNQTHAARYLGITRNTLIYRMQKFQLRQPS